MSEDNDIASMAGSGLFDVEYYSRKAELRFAGEADALRHYDQAGWRAGLSPSPLFDTRFYLKRNREVAEAGLNPLLHYVQLGRREGRRPRLGRAPMGERPSAPEEARWLELARGPRPSSPPDTSASVDVVIPVYRGRDDTLACIESVLASSNRTPFRLVVIDDASPDAALVLALRRLADQGLIELLTNPSNLGFVETANRGLALSHKRDVLLLNSDTLVYGDWLDRIRAHVLGAPRVATVTPMSNNATILSYPYAPGNNNQRFELADAELDEIFSRVNRGRSADIPTGVGFCLYLVRDALRELGTFDPEFSPGYGEENDFCMRAQAAGWRNLAALDVFVRHSGESSFSDATGRKARATDRLMARYPHYMPQVEAFTASDPLRPAREAVDVVRAARLSAGRGVLMVEHGWRGGVERHLLELAALLEREGVHSFRMAPEGERLTLEPVGDFDLPNLPRLDPGRPEQMGSTLTSLNLGHVHIHSLVTVPFQQLGALVTAFAEADLAFDFTWHDYAPICPRITMVDWGGVYCESPSTAYCQACVDKAGTRFGQLDAYAWREAYRSLLTGARRNFAPDADVARRLGRYLPGLAIEVRPHPRVEPPRVSTFIRRSESPVRTVGVLGRIGPFKGSGVLLRLAGDALERRLPIRFRLHGATTRAELHGFPNMEFAGEYLDEELEARLSADPPDLLFFPSVWPETFSYTLDVALRTGLHPVCFDIGAPARRLRALGGGTLLPLELALHAGALNDRLLGIELHPSGPLRLEPEREWESADAYYGGLPARGTQRRDGERA